MSFSRIRNLTPHVLRFVGSEESVVEVPPEAQAARLVLAPDEPDGAVPVGELLVPMVRTAATHAVVGLPSPEPGVLFVVARPVAQALPDRHDLAYPHRTVRDRDGVVIGCQALGRPAAVQARDDVDGLSEG